MTGFEPVTSSLPRKRSTPELHRLKCLSKPDPFHCIQGLSTISPGIGFIYPNIFVKTC